MWTCPHHHHAGRPGCQCCHVVVELYKQHVNNAFDKKIVNIFQAYCKMSQFDFIGHKQNHANENITSKKIQA